MDRAEAEAIYDAGREACVKVLLALANQVERLEGRVGRLEEEVRELRRDSANSSLPPSVDPGAGKRRRKGKRSPRNPGAQPGHPGSGRGFLPIEQVDEVIEHLPESCSQCGHSLADQPARGPIRRHQVAELPEIAVTLTEHRLARRRCPGCGALTQAELVPEVPRERFGPRLQGAIATLAAGFRLSRRQVADLCDELFGLQIAVGSIDATLTSWSAEGGTEGGSVKLRVFSPLATKGEYQLVGESADETVGAGTAASFPVQIAVQPGDVIGLDTGPSSTYPTTFEGSSGDVYGYVLGNPTLGKTVGPGGEFKTGTGSKYLTNIEATLTAVTRTLHLNETGAGKGTVTSSPAGLSCASSCSAEFDLGSAVTLTALPARGPYSKAGPVAAARVRPPAS